VNKLIVAVSATLLLAACGGGDSGGTQAGSDETPAPEVAGGEVTYFGTEFAFEGPATIAAGETTFTLMNQGEQPHLMFVTELLDGKTLEDVHTYLEEEGLKGPGPEWVKDVKGLEIVARPGKEKTAKPVELTPGTYAMLCFLPDKETKKPHAILGMTKEITVE